MANTGNTQQQIDYGAAANDGTGDPLRTAFIKTDDNFDNIWLAGPVGSNITVINNTVQANDTNGNLILSPNGVGVIQTNSKLLPRLNNTYDLGSTALKYRAGYFGTGGLTVDGNVAITGNLTAGNISYTSNVFVGDLEGSVFADDSTVMVDAVDNVLYAGRAAISGNVSATYFIGNGSQLTGLAATYGNANVVANLAALGSNPVSTTGNISGNFFVGNGRSLTGITSSYGNANVVANLSALGSNPVSTTGNISGNYFIGNGSQLTGMAATYGNANVVANLAALGSNPVSTTGNISGNYFIGNGSQLTGMAATYGNANVVANLAALGSNPVSTTGNVTASYFIGNGSLLTSLPAPAVTQDITSNGAMSLMTYDGVIKYVSYATVEPSSGNLTAGNVSSTGNVTAGNLIATGNIVLTGSLVGSGASPAPSLSGFSSVSAVTLSATGNITSGNVNTGKITLTNGAVIRDTAGDAVAFGQNAGNTSQGSQAVAIGLNAGANSQAAGAVAVGVGAGQLGQSITGIAIGDSAGYNTQGPGAVAIGAAAGFDSQGQYSVAMGYYAGNSSQGANAVAIGYFAGYANQATNSIILNATGAQLNQTTANTFTVKPVRQANTANAMYYDASTGEITYDTTSYNAGTPAWTSAGAITFTATTTTPTKGTTTSDNISYRQLGAKQWEIILTYIQTVANGVNGSGDYLVTLPNSLSFDTTLPSQQITTTNIGTNTYALMSYIIPSGSGLINNDSLGAQVYPIVYDATKFRILTTTWGSAIQCWGSGYYSLGGDDPKIQLTFRFTST